MLLNFKKLGDILSLDDYNAIVYLLMKNDSLSEEIILTADGYSGRFGEYFFSFSEDELLLTGEGYLVLDETSTLNFTVNTDFVGDYTLTLRVHDSVVSFDEDNDGVEYRELSFTGHNGGGRENITVPLNLIGEDTYISTEAKITIQYTNPIIDKSGESIQTDNSQQLIKTPTDLLTVIKNAPTDTTTRIQLTPGQKYDLFSDDEDDDLNKNIIIDKKIEISSGSIPSTLDCNGKHRHFYITETGSLTLRNIELTNGCAYDEEEDTNKGGSIFIKSSRDVNNIKLEGKLNVEACKFTNNTASQGGAIYNEDGIVNIQSTLFYNNQSKSRNNVLGDGGAIYNEGVS